MLITLSGIVMLVRPLQPQNAHPPMLVTLSGIVTLVNPLQKENAQDPMFVTLLGIFTSPLTPQTRVLPFFDKSNPSTDL
jgi:hypothetical protein